MEASFVLGLDFTSLTNLAWYIGAFFTGFLLLLWVSLVIWTWRDIRARSQDNVLRISSVLLAILFPFLGLFIYWILRPRYTLVEIYERQLEEESLLADVTERPTCPSCHHRVEPDFQICPSCSNKLKRPCPNCERLLDFRWKVCPYCTYADVKAGDRTAAKVSVSES